MRKATVSSPSQPVTCIGIDDWAYKRRRSYGTLICDLETGKPLDLLPDRTVQTVSAWLQEHPEIKIISRDRWSEYATAAQKGAPQARQVADRWHLLHNLTESVATLFPRIRAEVTPAGAIKKANKPSSTHLARQQQYQELEALSQQGLGPQEMAPLVGLSERTVYRWLAQATASSWQHHTRSNSVIDPYYGYLLKRWQEGCRKGSVLCGELKAQGYRGSERAIYRYLTFLQEQAFSEELPLERRSRNAVFEESMRCKRGIVSLVAELRREAEGGDKVLPKESRHRGDLRLIAERCIEGDDLNPECSIGSCRIVSSMQRNCWLSIGTCRR